MFAALILACQHAHVSSAEELIHFNADIYALNHRKESALIAVVLNNSRVPEGYRVHIITRLLIQERLIWGRRGWEDLMSGRVLLYPLSSFVV